MKLSISLKGISLVDAGHCIYALACASGCCFCGKELRDGGRALGGAGVCTEGIVVGFRLAPRCGSSLGSCLLPFPLQVLSQDSMQICDLHPSLLPGEPGL